MRHVQLALRRTGAPILRSCAGNVCAAANESVAPRAVGQRVQPALRATTTEDGPAPQNELKMSEIGTVTSKKKKHVPATFSARVAHQFATLVARLYI